MATVEYAPREIVGSKAFNLEYEPRSSGRSIKEDLISYLGEYRFEIPKFNYSLYFNSKTQDIVDSEGESMVARAKKTILERTLRGDPVHREIRELSGLESLARQLEFKPKGVYIYWSSPPGPEREGYGDYGFIYTGKLGDFTVLTTKEGEKLPVIKIPMTAVRLENPTIAQYNSATSELSELDVNFREADEFLSSPMVSYIEKDIDRILKRNFSFQEDKTKSNKFNEVIRILDPLMDRVVFAIQHGTKGEKLAAFYALENYTIELRDGQDVTMDVDYIIATRNYQPPRLFGSCGSTGDPQSNTLFGAQSEVTRSGGLLDLREPFECPRCSYTTYSPVGNRCPGCGLTKEEYAAEKGEVCD